MEIPLHAYKLQILFLSKKENYSINIKRHICIEKILLANMFNRTAF